MPRVARIVVPGVPHHVTQRGNNRQQVFFSEADRELYLEFRVRDRDKHLFLVRETGDCPAFHGERLAGYCPIWSRGNGRM